MARIEGASVAALATSSFGAWLASQSRARDEERRARASSAAARALVATARRAALSGISVSSSRAAAVCSCERAMILSPLSGLR